MKSSAVSALFWGSALATIKVDDTNSVKDAAKSVATNLLTYYHGNEQGQTPGILPGPPTDLGNKGEYYWWEGATLWNTLIDYWRATGDDTYNDLVTEGILWQAGPGNNFMPPNITAQLANDDQGFWAMTAMTAAEVNFTNPSSDADTQWLALAKAVFDVQVQRWDEGTCDGGLRWQIPLSNAGYDYKNSISTGVLFNVASRLARLTGNDTYAHWAEKTYIWMETVGFLDAQGNIYDGAHVGTNCTDIAKQQFSHNMGVFVQGAAHMYNATNGGETWRTRLTTLTSASSVFTKDNCVPTEVACEERANCNTDMLVFKSIFLRGLAAAVQYAPFTSDKFSCVFEASSKAVASTCSDAGGDKGAECGFVWTAGEDDGSRGAGEQMNALEALSIRYQIQAGGPAGSGSGPAAGGNSTGGSGSGSPTGSGSAPSGTGTVDDSGAGAMKAGAGAAVVMAVIFGALLA